jgi:hypothetical protein
MFPRGYRPPDAKGIPKLLERSYEPQDERRSAGVRREGAYVALIAESGGGVLYASALQARTPAIVGTGILLSSANSLTSFTGWPERVRARRACPV